MQFAKLTQPGDWVAFPSRFNPTIHLGKITGPYQCDPKAEDTSNTHAEWIGLPKTSFIPPPSNDISNQMLW